MPIAHTESKTASDRNLLARALPQIIPTERSSYLATVALISTYLRRSPEEVVAIFVEQEAPLLVGEWEAKYLPDRRWVIFNRRSAASKLGKTSSAAEVVAAIPTRVALPSLENTSRPAAIALATIAPQRQDSGKTAVTFDPVDVGNRARAYRNEMRTFGFPEPTATEAVHYILSKMGWTRGRDEQ